MRVTKDTRARLEELVAQGVLSAGVVQATLATMVEDDGSDASCMACNSGALVRDYICGSCSLLKIDDERKFWERVRRYGSGKTDRMNRKARPFSVQTTAGAARSTDFIIVDQAEVRRMIDELETDLTLLSWREAFLGSIPEDRKEMYERERVSVEGDRSLTGRLLQFWTAKLSEETIGAPCVSAG